MRDDEPRASKAPKLSMSGQHPAVQDYRKKLESIVDGVGVAVDALDARLAEFLTDLKSSHPPPNEVPAMSEYVLLPPERQWEKSAAEIATLDPLVHSTVKDEIARFAFEGIYVKIAPQGARRSFEEQERLFLQGRPELPGGKPGAHVTWVRVGVHCFGLAWDFAIDGLTDEARAVYPIKESDCRIDGRVGWPSPSGPGLKLWLRMAEISSQTFHLRCGAFFKPSPDYPHREWTDGLLIADLIAGKRPSKAPDAPRP